ncbi:hypothetical protein BT96DRAFT_791668, partial [Gymnopus androsaceus JB14]
VRLWMTLEVAYGPDAPSKTLPAGGRPFAVHSWIKSSRDHGHDFELVDKDGNEVTFASFTESVCNWWRKLNPAWCWVGDHGPLKRLEDELWDKLRTPGINGLYSIFILLQ